MRYAGVLLALMALANPALHAGEEEVGKDYAPVFPEPLAFDPSEWETSAAPPSVADPRAQKGGTIVLATRGRLSTLRTEGPNSRLPFLHDLHAMVYEPLLSFANGGYVPNLATHWQIDEDRMTFRFRLDERARWADGREVTADDVVATVEHLTNPDREDPLVQKWWEEIVEYVKLLDKYTVEIKTRAPRWRSLISIATMYILPAAYIRMDGKTYLEEWNWRLPPGSGPYEIRPEEVVPERSIALRRRPDWWGAALPENQGVANFDSIEWQVVPSEELMYEKLLAGEIDMYHVGRAEHWVNELDQEPKVRKGWIQKRRIYSRAPRGFGGFCFNLRRPPFDDRNVRLAFAHLYNREKIVSTLLHDQYEHQDSYFPGQEWARPNAECVPYDPLEARRLLAESGWTGRDDEGHLVNERGDRFPVLAQKHTSPSFLRIFGVVRDDLWEEAGIRLELTLADYSWLLKKVWNYEFQLVYWVWTASHYPDPLPMFHSKYADPKETNNLNGFANEEADRLMEAYRTEWDPAKRRAMLQRLDAILFNAHLYALGWYAPCWRIVYWDRFGHPREYLGATTHDWFNVMCYWWYDPERGARTQANLFENRPNYPDDPDHQYDEVEQDWWRTHTQPMPR